MRNILNSSANLKAHLEISPKMMQIHRNNLQYFCRTCLEQLQSDASNYHIGQTPNLTKLLIICTSLSIKDDEDAVYPQWLCKKCYDMLQHFRHFREMTLRSADVLHKIVKDSSDHTNPTTSTSSGGYFHDSGYTANQEVKIEVGATHMLENYCRNEKADNYDEFILDSDSSAPSTSTAKKRKQINEHDGKFECRIVGCYEKFKNNKTLEAHMKLEHASDDDTQDTNYDVDIDTRYCMNQSASYDGSCETPSYLQNSSYLMDRSSINYDIPSTSMPTPTPHALFKVKKSIYNDELPLPYILACGFFVVVTELNSSKYEISSGGCIAECQVCKIKIRGSKRVTSNFLQHLKTRHPQHHNEYLQQKKSDVLPSRSETKHKKFEAKVLKFVVTTFSPLSIVEHPAFVMLFENENISLRCIANLLDLKYSDMITRIKSDLNLVNDVCCTTDIWIGRRKSFFGCTCHWINADFKRKSAALACYHFSGSQKIDDFVHAINEIYGINKEKLVCIVTDNGSNFLNFFKEFGIDNSSIKLNDNEIDSELDDETLIFQSTLNQLNNFKTLQCASKTLNLLATTDFMKSLQEHTEEYKLHLTVMKKCNAIWSKCNIPKTAEKISTIISPPLRTPIVTRGNSLYDAIKHLLSHTKKLNEITVAFDVENLSTSDIAYLHELIRFLQPIAEALDFLQKEEDSYYGYLVPTLLTLKVKIKKFLSFSEVKYLRKLVEQMEKILVERFESIFKLEPSANDAVVAAITCPTLKLINCDKLIQIWQETAPTCSVSTLKAIFMEEVQKCEPHVESVEVNRVRSGVLNHPFFDWLERDDDKLSQTNSNFLNYNQELSNFCLDADNTMNCLNKYPLIKNVFFKFNTPISSSAPVERLFPFAGIVNNYRWESLMSNNFEKFVLANSNGRYFK